MGNRSQGAFELGKICEVQRLLWAVTVALAGAQVEREPPCLLSVSWQLISFSLCSHLQATIYPPGALATSAQGHCLNLSFPETMQQALYMYDKKLEISLECI